MKKLFASFLLLAAVVLAGADFVWQAENIQDRGEWDVVNYGGATVLYGNVIRGKAAEGTFTAPEAGQYNMYVRASCHGGGFRYAEIYVNNMKYGKFGDEPGKPNGWNWIKASRKIPLRAGENKIKLVANSNFSRIDCIAFSTDDNYEPKVDANAKQTTALTGAQLEGIFRRPKGSGNGPKVLALVGGRPWVGNGFASTLNTAGFNVELLNSVYLAGNGGASIKQTPTDPVEPKALDGITPEFARLNKYDAVVVTGIPEKFQQKIFTSQRVEALKKFVEEGGTVVFTINAPASVNDLLPVVRGEDYEDEAFYVRRPEGKFYEKLPEKWSVNRSFNVCTLKPGARVIANIYNGDDVATPYAAVWNIGKGKVAFINANHERLQSVRQLMSWAYGGAHWAALIADALQSDKPIKPEKCIAATAAEIQPKELEKVAFTLEEAPMSLSDSNSTAEVKDNQIIFGDGSRIVIQENRKKLDFYFPGCDKPYIRDVEIPQITYPLKADKVADTSTAEATSVESKTAKSKAVWSIANVRGGNPAVIEVVSDDGGRFEWSFKTGKAVVDGRVFAGIAEKVDLKSLPGHLLSQFVLNYRIDADNVRLRRFACYEDPRGYVELDISGKANADSKNLGFFSAAQPFGWVEGKDALIVDMVEAPISVTARYAMKQSEKTLGGKIIFNFGRINAPRSGEFFWHLAADPKYNTNNDWIAIYQFVRKHLRQVAGFPEVASQPCAVNSNTCTAKEKEEIMKLAGKSGFRLFYLNRCPSPMESFDTESSDADIELCKKYGMRGYPWFPCAHSPDKTETVVEHPDWYIKDENGKLFQYFSHFYVGNLDNPGFKEWHYGLVDRMISHGLGTVWYDMGGAFTGTVDFSLPECRSGFYPQVDLYRHFYEKGAWVVTEGMNPLVLDGYLFRPDKYTETNGREFALVGAQPGALNTKDQLYLDHFRMAMYGTFIQLNLDCLAFNFDFVPENQKQVRRMVDYVPTINAALDLCGVPFVRETPFGTSWIGKNGGALFFFNSVKDFSAVLPEGFIAESLTTADGKVEQLNGVMPSTVPAKSIIVLKKNVKKAKNRQKSQLFPLKRLAKTKNRHYNI